MVISSFDVGWGEMVASPIAMKNEIIRLQGNPLQDYPVQGAQYKLHRH